MKNYIKSRTKNLSSRSKNKVLKMSMNEEKYVPDCELGVLENHRRGNIAFYENIKAFKRLCQTLEIDPEEYGDVDMIQFLKEIQEIVKSSL